MECKAYKAKEIGGSVISIDLTRMECKGYTELASYANVKSIDLTRMECKDFIRSKDGCWTRV